MRLLYLHGFRSSPQSDKALMVAQYCQTNGLNAPIMPQLPISPLESIQLCEQLIAQHAITAVCGSSLGGFYALYLAEKYGLRCGLINPAITPWVDMEESKNHERYEIDELDLEVNGRYVDQLKPYYTPTLTHPERFLALIGLADEVLDPEQMRRHLIAARQIIVPEGDHAMSDFGGHLDELMRFVQGE